MILHHFRRSKEEEFKLKDLAGLTEFVNTRYDPQVRDSHTICAMLGSKYSNLTPVKIGTMIYGGNVQVGGHTVLLVNDSELLIDPIGDYVCSSNLTKLKFEMAPWIYSLNMNKSCYLSQNRFPCYDIELDSPDYTKNAAEWAMLSITGKALNRNIRIITL